MAAAKPVLTVLSGAPLWPPPIWLMRQAGRYLPEYRQLRKETKDFLTFCTTPELATEATLQPVRRFALDAAILFSDILLLPSALGSRVTFEEGLGPRVAPLRDAASLKQLARQLRSDTIAPVLETIRAVRQALPPAVALIGFTGAPFTLACYLVDGQGREFPATRHMAYGDPSLLSSLIDRLAEAAVPYLIAQADAGAEALMVFDSWAGMLSPALFRRFVIAPTARIVAAVKSVRPHTPLIGFPRLAGLMLGAYARETGLDAVGLDSTADVAVAATLLPPSTVLQGNLDPFSLLAGGQGMAEEARAIAATLRSRPHIFNLGHGVRPETPPENVAALVQILRAA